MIPEESRGRFAAAFPDQRRAKISLRRVRNGIGFVFLLVGMAIVAAACSGFSDSNPGTGSSGAEVGQTGEAPEEHPFCLNANCHAGKEFDPEPALVSQREWQLQNGEALGVWTERGIHPVNDTNNPLPATMSCYQCHTPTCNNCHDNDFQVHAAGPESPIFPPSANPEPGENCAEACHPWVRAGETVTTQGFVNASGDPEQTTYTGPISPGELLQAAQTDKPAHYNLWVTYGCNGFCHGGSDAPHGTIVVCKSCHNFQFSETDELNLHSTHVSFISAEQAAADPAASQEGSPACNYCHSSPASCWNCHLSAHDPITPYWEIPAG